MIKKGSWKTTVAGAGLILAALGGWAGAFFDGDPATEPNYQLIVSGVITGIGLIFAKDYNVSGQS